MLQEIISSVCEEMYCAVDMISTKKFSDTKDKCLRVSGLLDILKKEFDRKNNRDMSDIIVEVSNSINFFLLEGYYIVNKSTLTQDNNYVSSESDQLENFYPVRTKPKNFSQIVGNDAAKQSLYENIVLRFKIDPKLKSELYIGIRKLSNNILLFGPPGCGKTALVEAAAGEARVNCICVRPSDILSKYQGESEKSIRNLIGNQSSNTIIFFDEFDSIATTRSNTDDSSQSRRLIAELLLFLNQITSDAQDDVTSREIVVVAATNRIEDLDEAIVRRFGTKIFVGPLDKISRKKLIALQIRDVYQVLNDDELDVIAERTEGWSISDLQTLCKESAMISIRECIGYGEPIHQSAHVRAVCFDDFCKSFASLLGV